MFGLSVIQQLVTPLVCNELGAVVMNDCCLGEGGKERGSACAWCELWPAHKCCVAVQSLIKDKSFRKYVELYAKDQDKFFDDFAAAYQKLLHLGVPVNNPGQHAPA